MIDVGILIDVCFTLWDNCDNSLHDVHTLVEIFLKYSNANILNLTIIPNAYLCSKQCDCWLYSMYDQVFLVVLFWLDEISPTTFSNQYTILNSEYRYIVGAHPLTVNRAMVFS